ncbi:MAG: hypothetical protein ACREBE_21275, partial [bacterium]
MGLRVVEDGTLSTEYTDASSEDGGPGVSAREERRYRIEDEVARGGAGRILRARDLTLDRKVALKEPLDPRHDARL